MKIHVKIFRDLKLIYRRSHEIIYTPSNGVVVAGLEKLELLTTCNRKVFFFFSKKQFKLLSLGDNNIIIFQSIIQSCAYIYGIKIMHTFLGLPLLEIYLNNYLKILENMLLKFSKHHLRLS